MNKTRSVLSLSLLLVGIWQNAQAENWPAWRGPRGDGSSAEKSAPTKWSGTENVVWKTELPGLGHSSAIVWGDRVFTCTAILDKQERALLCLDRKTGKILWQQTVLTSPLEKKHPENSYASCTPATDGERVYVTFLDIEQVAVAAHDFTGKQLWLVRTGEFQNDHGFSASPVLWEDKVIVSAQSKKGNFLVALNKADGTIAWKTELDNPSNSFGQPYVRVMNGRAQIILCGDKAVKSFDPKDGKLLWRVENQATDSVVTPVFNEKAGLLLTSSSWPKKELKAIKPDGQGDVTTTKVVWSNTSGAPYVPSPISCGDYFMTIADAGKEIYCFTAATGEVLWREKFSLPHASPVAIGDLVYLSSDEGVTRVVRPGAKYDLVAENTLGEKCFGSIAISEGQIFLRAEKNLYCIGAK